MLFLQFLSSVLVLVFMYYTIKLILFFVGKHILRLKFLQDRDFKIFGISL